jgi:DNA polymerase delta subunit 4
MPTTRRSTGGARAKAGPGKNQSTISFASKVSKPGVQDAGKKAIVSETSEHRKPASSSVSPPASAASPTSERPTSPPAVDDIPADEEQEDKAVRVSPYAEVEEIPAEPEKAEAEIEAGKVSQARIAKYWRAIEVEGQAKRVHQEDLSTAEKILRYFDMSSEYGVWFSPSLLLPAPPVADNLLCSPVLASRGQSDGRGPIGWDFILPSRSLLFCSRRSRRRMSVRVHISTSCSTHTRLDHIKIVGYQENGVGDGVYLITCGVRALISRVVGTEPAALFSGVKLGWGTVVSRVTISSSPFHLHFISRLRGLESHLQTAGQADNLPTPQYHILRVRW